MDPRASDAAKIAALKALRGQQIGGQDARSHEVVLALIELVNRSDDPNARTDVYRNLHGVDDPTLRESMLRSLSSDPSPMVREQAAKDIDTFLADPSVAAALRSAAESDPDLKVRTHAAETLGNKH